MTISDTAGARSTRSSRSRAKKSVIVGAFAACAWSSLSLAAAGSPVAGPATPNSCIVLNGGDYNACNVGNGGRGDVPYRPITMTPSQCIRLNGGDHNACNVGNSGRGDVPYRPLHR